MTRKIKKENFLKRGYTHLESLLAPQETKDLLTLYDELLADKSKTAGLRSDLAGGGDQGNVERITQIMRPSIIEPKLLAHPAYSRALEWAQELLGKDIALDFDMFINKAPHTNTATPWHQDAAYWINMPDKRAVSCWIALDQVSEENGCMWFIDKDPENPIHPHQALPNGGALYCETDANDALSMPLSPGGCTFHDGFTLHFSRGNITSSQRRALILNFRPESMIQLQRSQGIDHTGKREFRNKNVEE
ncbi:SnoK [Echinicola pacifica]|uniref:SnoK n=1 Tax=Echinicola pacifica TaxID=346377 RepID=A0A918UIP8_9BACT|nr:phytanoyl-CoA dioxygenase family protein [Echinicola pacifica]GGZ13078.1 SnoK [Echinicola pacifica]